MAYGPLPIEATEVQTQTLDDVHAATTSPTGSVSALLPTAAEKAALDAAVAPAAGNAFATLDDLESMLYTGTYAFAKGAANHSVVTIQVQDRHGVNLTKPTMAMVWLSDAASGAGLAAVDPTTFTITTGSELIDPATVKSAMIIQTDATGKAVVDIQSVAKTLYYVALQEFGGDDAHVSRKMVSGDYG
jgi:hypothetical protein